MSSYRPPRKSFSQLKKEATNGALIIYKKIGLLLAVTAVIGIIMYFWVVAVMANIDTLWGLFPNNEPQTTTVAPPHSPFLSSLPKYTKNKTVTIKGYAEEGVTIKLMVNGAEHSKNLADKEGAFIFDAVELVEGENQVFAVALNSTLTLSAPSPTTTIVYTNKPPKLEMETPKENQSLIQKENSFLVSGLTDKDCLVTVNDHRAIVDLTGKFTLTVYLTEGVNKIKILAKDQAGNEATIERTVTYFKP
ncbi:MAG: hypothetical protein Q8N84_00385 [bacterium]|nr:hypothetical protein [bacterium]